jgi:hypothetical protein
MVGSMFFFLHGERLGSAPRQRRRSTLHVHVFNRYFGDDRDEGEHFYQCRCGDVRIFS